METSINNPEEAYHFNDEVTKLITDLADQATSQKTGRPRTNKKKWYDWQCRLAKRSVAQVEPKVDRNPFNNLLRDRYFLRKKEYRAMIRSKKGEFLYKINERINESNSVNWSALKELSSNYKDGDSFDIYDLFSFHKFFNDLYNQRCESTAHPKIEECKDEIQPLEPTTMIELQQLNKDFTTDELNSVIKRLNNNKSSSVDLISNEMLKNSKEMLRSTLLKLFNACLQNGTYPWNCSLTTPLHKKGDKQNPDNYRAITIGSCLGKLFSSLLLQRLLEFRSTVCPDSPNQLGFRSGAQCSDHILTLNTIIEKHVKRQKSRVFACFVDYRKAFDTVCREALMYKLNSMGISGNFFACLKHMYSNSKTRIKLIQKLSESIDVTIGTEQGHPLSPELFKMFVHELSQNLNDLDNTSVPCLNDFPISHLLWADDLILLALNAESLQKQLNCLFQFVSKWELQVNINKTNIMVFNSGSKLLQCSYGFRLGSLEIRPTRSYCYLGITFSLKGSFKLAIEELRKKALRAFFSIRRIVDTRALSTSTMLKLVDSLIKPVALYSCQVWLPTTNIMKELTKSTNRNLLHAATKDAFETTHLKVLKWILGVHKKATNSFCYGDTGRLPWAISVIPQCLRYFERGSAAANGPNCVNTLLHHAFEEQKKMNLQWYEVWNTIQSHRQTNIPPVGSLDRSSGEFHENLFISQWRDSIGTQSKLKFYRQVKNGFGEEAYLQLPNSSFRSQIAKLRSSSHDLMIEKGRYGRSPLDLSRKICRFCCSNNDNTMINFEYLPCHEVLIYRFRGARTNRVP